MKKINKGFLFYFGILIAILIAAFLICVVILVCSPGTSVFGLTYYKIDENKTFDQMQVYTLNETGEGEAYLFKENALFRSYEISNIKVVSNNHNIKILKANSSFTNQTEFRVTIANSTKGFITKKLEEPIMAAKYYEDTRTLEFTAKVPEGFWTTSNASRIYIQIPATFDTTNINLDINANKSDVLIGDTVSGNNLNPNTLQVKSVSVNTTSSLILTQFAKIGSDSVKGNCVIEAGSVSTATKIDANDLTIKTDAGSSNFNKAGDAFSANSVRIESNSSKSEYGNIVASEITMINTYGSQIFKTVAARLNILAESKNCDYTFDIINGDLIVGSAATEEAGEQKANKCNIIITESISGSADIHTTGKFTAPVIEN